MEAEEAGGTKETTYLIVLLKEVTMRGELKKNENWTRTALPAWMEADAYAKFVFQEQNSISPRGVEINRMGAELSNLVKN